MVTFTVAGRFGIKLRRAEQVFHGLAGEPAAFRVQSETIRSVVSRMVRQIEGETLRAAHQHRSPDTAETEGTDAERA